jgi:hypothetical protein
MYVRIYECMYVLMYVCIVMPGSWSEFVNVVRMIFLDTDSVLTILDERTLTIKVT